MSAFYDIWLGEAVPKHKRVFNSDWKQVGNIWQSLPADDKGFLQQYTAGDYQLTLIGQLYEVLSLQEVLNRCVHYIKNATANYDDPAGHYIIFVQHTGTKEMHVFTNRLGSYHAYYSDENIISTYYLGMAKTSNNKQLDWEGITGFMAMGYFPDDTTYLQGIRIFEPASYYHFNALLTLQQQKRYRQWRYEPKPLSTEVYCEQLYETLQDSLSVAVKGQRVALPISGGLDSRLLAGDITTGQIPYTDLQAFSYGYTEHSLEIKIARQIAVQRNIPLYDYVMPDYLFDELDDITGAVELFQYIDGTRQASAKKWLDKNADVVIGGHWGDVWMDDMGVAQTKDLQAAFQKKIIKKGSAWLLENICSRQISQPKDYLNDYYTSFLGKHNDIKDADYLFKIYKTDQWSFRWTTASVRMYQAASMPVLPFYDKRIVDLFSTIPTDIVKDRELEIAYIKQYHNDLAKITWQEYDADLYNYKLFNNRNIAYRAVKKVQRTLSNEKTIQRNWEVFYLNPSGKRKLEDILIGNKHLSTIASPQKIKELLDDLQNNPTAANGYSVSMLLTFTLFLNQVFE